jgi:hypothetical protein
MTENPSDTSTINTTTIDHQLILDDFRKATSNASFPIRFALAFFALAIATHAFAAVFWHWLESQVHAPLLVHLLLSLFALVACVLVAGTLWNMRLETHHHKKIHLGFIILISSLGALGVVGICHDFEKLVGQAFSGPVSLKAETQEVHHPSIIELLSWLIFTVLCAMWLAFEERNLPKRSLSQKKAQAKFSSPNTAASPKTDAIQHLILPLTLPTNDLVPIIENGVIIFPGSHSKSKDKSKEGSTEGSKEGSKEGSTEGSTDESKEGSILLDGTSDKLASDISKLNETRHSWQQMLRAIEPHVDTLRSVWIFGSDESAEFVDDAIRFLKAYLPNVEFHRVSISPLSSRKLKFNNYNDLETVIESVLESIHARFHGVSDRNITIDVTGGTKVASVVAAAVTYRRQTCFQYVDTMSDAQGNFPVHQYDIVFETRPEL